MHPSTYLKPGALFLALSCLGYEIACGEDSFSLSIDSNSQLVIAGPQNIPKTALAPSTVDQVVKVGDTSFRASYGQNENGLLTAVISPDTNQPKDLHFIVLNKKIDTDDKAIVTLDFSNAHDQVQVDPGSSGSVQVNSFSMKKRATDGGVATPIEPESLAGSPSAPIHIRCNPEWYQFQPSLTMPVLYNEGPVLPQATPPPFYWPEPVTSPMGPTSAVGPDEMKLVESEGDVSVRLADGTIQPGSNGMILPCGSTVMTQDHASTAIFMGGVNSVRLMPNTQVTITQSMQGSTRDTLVDLDHGIVFSRVGSHQGEVQNYQVRTPEGIARATGTEFADVAQNHRHYLFVAKGSVHFSHDQQSTDVSGTSEAIQASMFDDSPSGCKCLSFYNGLNSPLQSSQDIETGHIFYEILNQAQPYNHKVVSLIGLMLDSRANESQMNYYNHIRRIYFESSRDGTRLFTQPPLNPFQVPPLTPF